MKKSLIDTLILISNREKESGHASVFIPIRDFSWYNERNGQLTKLYEADMIAKPRFFDDGVETRLTEEGRAFVEKQQTIARPSVFISYNWGCEKIADELQTKLKPYSDVKRDKTSVKPWGDLTEFMNSIREQDHAVLIVSDAYLRSDACLYEVMQLMKDEGWDDKVMYIVTDDTHIYKPIGQFDYIDYWEKACEELKELLSLHDPANTVELADELRKYEKIKLHIGEFMAKVKRSSNPKLDDAIDAVVERVKQFSPMTEDISLLGVTETNGSDRIELDESQIHELRKGWNFHNDIALRLEVKARHVYGDTDRPYTKIYDADSIENGRFAEVMIDILRESTGHDNDREDIDDFVKECAVYIGKTGYEIAPEKSQQLLNKLLSLIDQ